MLRSAQSSQVVTHSISHTSAHLVSVLQASLSVVFRSHARMLLTRDAMMVSAESHALMLSPMVAQLISSGDAHLVVVLRVSLNALVNLIAQLILHSDARMVDALLMLSVVLRISSPPTFQRPSTLLSPPLKRLMNPSFT
jgi:hypothetical protein